MNFSRQDLVGWLGLLFLTMYASTTSAVAQASRNSSPQDEVGDVFASLEGDLSRPVRLTTYGLSQGLPSLSLRSLAIDAEGMLWIGTSSGLYSYDGAQFRPVPAQGRALMNGERIRALHVDRNGVLWVGVSDGALVQCRGRSVSIPAGLEQVNRVLSMLDTSDGSLWFGGSEGLVRRLSSGAVVRLHCQELSTDATSAEIVDGAFTVHSLAEDPSDGSVYAATHRGVLRWSGGTDLELLNREASLGVFFDESGGRWELQRSGVILRNGERQSFDRTTAGTWLYTRSLGPGRQLIGSPKGNFVLYTEGEEPTLRPLSLSSPIRCIASHGPGGVWIATISDGLMLAESRKHFILEPPTRRVGRPLCEVVSVDSDRVIVNGAEDNGVLLVTRPDRQGEGLRTRFFPTRAGLNVRTQDACLSETGEILLATSAGLGRLSDGLVELMDKDGTVITKVVRGDGGLLWVRQDDQVVERHESGELTGRSFDSPGRWSETFVKVGESLFLTEGRRLFECDLKTMAKTEVMRSEEAALRALYVDRLGALWVTSYGDGLFRLRRDGRLDRWSIREGLPDRFLGWMDEVQGAPGSGWLWLNSNRGAISVSMASLDAVAAGTADLLDCRLVETGESSGIGGAALDDGTLILPTMEGVIALDSATAARPPNAPRVYLREVRINEVGVPLEEQPSAAGAANLEFFFDVVSLPSAHQVETQSMLMGHDEDWVSGDGGRSRRYTNLDAGDYQFAVRARNSTGGWSVEARSLPIGIRRHWYARSEVQFAFIGGLLAAAYVAFRAYTGRLLSRSQRLEAEIARRKRAERELEEQRGQFESVLEGAHDGIFAFDRHGRILYANPAMHWTLGAASVDLAGAEVFTLGIPGLSDKSSLRSLISASEVRQRWKTLEGMARRISGEPFEIEVSIASDASSDHECFVGIVRDVSDRKKMVERLRFSEERYRRLYQTAPMAIVVWRPSLRILERNQHATDLFGWESERQLSGSSSSDLSLLDLMAGEASVTAMRSSIRRVLGGGRTCVDTVRTRVRRGEVRNCRWHLAPLMQSNGRVWAFISMVIDMSEEDRIAIEFKALRSQLARAEETERARIARELHDDLSQRIAAVALDLQLNEGRISDHGDADLAATFADLRSSVELVASDMHTLSRQLHPTVLDDLGLLSALRSECARRAKRSEVEIVCEGTLPSEVEPRGAPGLALFRVVQEALQNALTHGRATRIAVAIFQDGDRLELTVEDNGCGFTMQGAGSGEAVGRRGIGFASMRERMILVGGDLRVSTMLGTGTVVRAALPLRHAEEGAAIMDESGTIPGPVAGAAFGSVSHIDGPGDSSRQWSHHHPQSP